MNQKWIWVLACMLLSQLLCTDGVYPYIKVGQDIYDWTLEPAVDGGVHASVMITLGSPCSYYVFQFSEDYSVEDMRAWEVETGKGITVISRREENRKKYIFEFGNEKEKGFKFCVEFCQRCKIEKEHESIYHLTWEWKNDCRTFHSARVILPENHEFLYTSYLTPTELFSYDDQIIVKYEKDVSESQSFKFGVAFSNDNGDEDGDGDGDGYSPPQDCDDNDSTVHPGAKEKCDGKDNDCNGEIDDIIVFVEIEAVNTDGNPLVGALVEVMENGNLIARGTTLGRGSVMFKIPGNKKYTIRVTKGSVTAEMDYEAPCMMEDHIRITLDIPCKDEDEDGYDTVDCGGDDCDDNDSTVYPGAEEICDGKDNDCNGEIDDIIVKVEIEVVDTGGNPVEGALVEMMEKGNLIAKGMTSCSGKVLFEMLSKKEYTIRVTKNGVTAEIDYEAPCITEDLIRITLDIPCKDEDEDGYDSLECGGDDCDDNDSTVYPGAEEVCDGKDNDCDGETDEDCIDKVNIWVDKGCGSTYSNGDEVKVYFIVHSAAPTARVSIVNYCSDSSTPIIEDSFNTNEIHSVTFSINCMSDQARVEIRAETETELISDCIYYVYQEGPVRREEISVDIWIDKGCGSTYNEGDNITVSFIVYSTAPTAHVSMTNSCGITTEYILEGEYDTNTVHSKTFPVECLADEARLDIEAIVTVGEIERKRSAYCGFDVCVDKDNDGWSVCKKDCDDNDSTRYPKAEEICDGKDNDCNGEIDDIFVYLEVEIVDKGGNPLAGAEVEALKNGNLIDYGITFSSGKVTLYVLGNKKYTIKVTKGDVFVEEIHETACLKQDHIKITLDIPCWDGDGDGFNSFLCGGDDCDDKDSTVYPGAEEVCDGIDNDCDGEWDEGFEGSVRIWVDKGKGCGQTSDNGDDAKVYYNNGNKVTVYFMVCSTAKEATITITYECAEGEKQDWPFPENSDFLTNIVYNIKFNIECPENGKQLKTTLWITATVDVGGKDIICEEKCILYVCFDKDNDECTTYEGDCNDNDANIYPGRKEDWDLKDNNCDLWIPEAAALLAVFGGVLLFLVVCKKKYEEKLFRGGGT